MPETTIHEDRHRALVNEDVGPTTGSELGIYSIFDRSAAEFLLE
jgi:hypothetical protein